MRRFPLLLAAALALLAFLAGQAAASATAGPFSHLPRDLPGFGGGEYTTAAGEVVRVFSADAYGVDTTFNQRWADFLSSIPHGPEISTVTVYIAPLERVREVCGRRALACYDGRSETIVTPGEDVPGRGTAQSILAHEYGHHVARHRKNDPWPAVDYGTKRWASYMNVCRQTRGGLFSPGNEGEGYRLNPGEGFAEAYRVLFERRNGLPESPFAAVDQLLYPDEKALQLVEQDVLEPWTGNTTTTKSSRFVKGNGIRRTYRFATPLDGTLELTLRAAARSTFTLRLLDPVRGDVLAESTATGGFASIHHEICGERSLEVRVLRGTSRGALTLQISKP